MNCVIVDDEPVARKGLAEYVSEVEFLNLTAQCENAVKAASTLKASPTDLIFLDIQMPKLSGIEFLKTLNNPPLVIITTAFSDYALEGYSLDVVDYLMKPITFERFLQGAQKAHERFSQKLSSTNRGQTEPGYFFVKCDSRLERLFYDKVLYIEALQNYVIIYTHDRKLITYLTMTSLESQLPGELFLKVHKSYIVSVSAVRAIEGNELLIREDRIPISRTLKEQVVQRILGNKLFKR